MNLIHKISLILTCLLWTAAVSASAGVRDTYYYQPIPNADALLQKGMHRIFRDKDGYMWYGTNNGLYRNDGYNLKVLRSDFRNKDLIGDNFITYIQELGCNIWFGTSEGCYKLDKNTLNISPLLVPDGLEDLNVFTISIVDDCSWVSYPGCLVKYDTDGNILSCYSFRNDGCAYFVANHPGLGLIVSIDWQGMYKYNPDNDTFEPWFHDDRYLNVQRMIYDQRNDCWWLGTWIQGILRFDPSDTSGNVYTPQVLPTNESGETTGDTYHMVLDDDNNYLWVTTSNNLYAFEIDSNKTLHQLDLKGLVPPGNKLLYEIYKDLDGYMWVSSFDSQSFIIKSKKRPNYAYSNEPIDTFVKFTNSTPALLSIAFTPEYLWMVQERSGIYAIDLKTHKVIRNINGGTEATMKLAKSAQNSNTVWAFHTWNNVMRLRTIKDGAIIEPFRFQIEGATHINTAHDEGDSIWIGANNGLYRHNLISGSTSRLNEHNTTAITRTSDSKVWSVSDKGVITSYVGGRVTDSLNTHLPVNTMATTTDGNIWCGTTHGDVFSFNSRNPAGTLAYHTDQCDLTGDAITNLVIDRYNHIWITTCNLVIEYNPRNAAVRRWPTGNPNISTNRFLPNSHWIKDDGSLAFAGMGGIVSFFPSQQIENMPQDVKIFITDVKIGSQSLLGNNMGINFNSDKIDLPLNATNISVEFSTLDIHNISHIRYAYRLDDIDKDWIYLPAGSNSAFYNRLKSGQHTLRIRATDCNGLWSEQVRSFVIYQPPLWYETWWTRIAAFIIAATLVVMGFRSYMKRSIRRERERVFESEEFKRLYSYIENHRSTDINENISTDTELMDRIKTHVLDHMSDATFDTNRLASIMNMSRSTLSRKTKALTGLTPLDYIKDIKLEYAAALLRQRNITVGEVIDAIGYSDYKNFARIFRHKYGIVPSEYQKQKK